MTSLSIEAMDGETDLYGKHADDLQEGIEIAENSISGTLKHVPEYTGFSDTPSEQSGNYLALKIEVPEEATVTTEVEGGDHGPVEVTDGWCVYRIKDEHSQKIKFTVRNGEESKDYTYSLEGLTLSEE